MADHLDVKQDGGGALPVTDGGAEGAQEEEQILSMREAWKTLSLENQRMIKFCAVLGVITIFVLPIVTVCLAVWKYHQEVLAVASK